ncbi:MAG: glycerol-3-phosphate dehydrogenase [Acidobacteria bacterium]|nr:MAG: glycerol-3-phosphate dehydrogenase [Acidobacteriota bacterium]
MNRKVAVIGAGSWGTALAMHAANCGHEVCLWVHSQDALKLLLETRENQIYFPGFKLPQKVTPTPEVSCVREVDRILFAVPSPHFRKVYEQILPNISDGAVLISAIKGMEPDSCKRISEVVKELSGNRFVYTVLSGPSFAQEVALKHPTAVVIGCGDIEISKEIQHDFSSNYFRLYYNPDITGIEVAACVKNIIAIAAGAVSGLGYGYNTLSGLITRGLAEVSRLVVALGGQPATLSGLAGLGDLILTCTGNLSRNRQVGIELGKGKKIHEITAQMRMVAEGVKTTKAIRTIAQRHGVSMPITEQVYRVIYEDQDPRDAILELMSRELKQE